MARKEAERRRPGAVPLADGRTRFRVWAPAHGDLAVVLRPDADDARAVPLVAVDRGYHEATVDDAPAGTRYLIRLADGHMLPDPASRALPDGVHGSSAVVDLDFPWNDGGWSGLRREDLVFYELHVGTFTPAGTYDGVVGELDRLHDLGVTALEIMPPAQFPGARNWGYDGVQPYAIHPAYGGPSGLQRLVDACHGRGLGLFVDVVYNHLGPEGNYLSQFGPYFTDAYHTPWGSALNYDGPRSDEVRRYFLDHALELVERYHVDGLRLDAIQTIYDRSTYPFLEQLADEVRDLAEALGRRVHLVGETDQNDTRLVRSPAAGGTGLDAIWADDLHHALHARLTGERSGYYLDFGRVDDVARAYRTGFAYADRYSPYRERRHGRSADGAGPARFVVCAQNHDQIGNRMLGERLSTLTDLDGQLVAAAVVILSPHLPLLFMGEEWGETAPFQYFVSHGDPGLVEAVRNGRASEFAEFAWQGTPPDPQDEATFERSRPNRALRAEPAHARVEATYRALLALRRAIGDAGDAVETVSSEIPPAVRVIRGAPDGRRYALLFHLGDDTARLPLPVPDGRWEVVLDTASHPDTEAGVIEATDTPHFLDRPRRSALVLRELPGTVGGVPGEPS